MSWNKSRDAGKIGVETEREDFKSDRRELKNVDTDERSSLWGLEFVRLLGVDATQTRL